LFHPHQPHVYSKLQVVHVKGVIRQTHLYFPMIYVTKMTHSCDNIFMQIITMVPNITRCLVYVVNVIKQNTTIINISADNYTTILFWQHSSIIWLTGNKLWCGWSWTQNLIQPGYYLYTSVLVGCLLPTSHRHLPFRCSTSQLLLWADPESVPGTHGHPVVDIIVS